MVEDLATFNADITELIVGGVLANPKPHPRVYLTVMSDLGVTADQRVTVPDSWTGVEVDSAKAGVDGLLASDAECWSPARPDMVFVAELDADVVQKFSEA